MTAVERCRKVFSATAKKRGDNRAINLPISQIFSNFIEQNRYSATTASDGRQFLIFNDDNPLL
jgi:hypothetical protein